MGALVDKSCKETGWVTPPRIVNPVRGYALLATGEDIFLDPATSRENPVKARNFFTEADDGLAHSWAVFTGRRWVTFLNPPYGPEFKSWVSKIATEVVDGCHLVALLPANRFETPYMPVLWSERLSAVCWVRRRIAFLRADGKAHSGNPHGSAVYLFNGCYGKFAEAFRDVGVTFRPTILSHPRA